MVSVEHVEKFGLVEGDLVEVITKHSGGVFGYFAGADENWLHLYVNGHARRARAARPYSYEDIESLNKLGRLPGPAEEPNVVECSDVGEW
jgi:hypothetical protein